MSKSNVTKSKNGLSSHAAKMQSHTLYNLLKQLFIMKLFHYIYISL